MCLGIPARILAVGVRHPDLASVDMGGVRRDVNIGLLDGADLPGPGDWVLVHMGFALERMTEQQADEAIQALGAERALEEGR
jgi:hydrogenase expression/formation protein HypC